MKKIVDKILELGKNTFKKFPVTIISASILTILLTIFIEDMEADAIKNIILGIAIFTTSTFLFESMDKRKIIYYIPSFIVAIVLTILYNIESMDPYNNRIIICYELSIFIVSLYINYKNSKLEISKYMINLLINLFKVYLIYGILMTGVSMIVGIFETLIFEFDTFNIILRIIILISGCYLTPSLLYTLGNVDYEPPKYAKIVIKNILQIILIIAFVIIYAYILKIIFLRDMPSNEVFRIITALFVLGLPIWTMASYFNDNNILDKINKILPYLFIPFVFLQIYALGVRIISNGITPTRYVGILLIIYEIIYLILYIIKKKHIDKIIPVLVIFIVIALVVPYINMYKVSIISQYHNLKIYLEKKVLSDEDKDKIQGAYYYLIEDNEELVNNTLTKNDINNIIFFNSNTKNKYEYYTANIDIINIKGYNKMYEVYGDSNSNTNLKDIELHDLEETIDITSIINNDILNDEFENYFNTHNEIVLDNNRKLVISYINIDVRNSKIYYISLRGYMLEK
ncbi:MAG: DUF4153 domain-containing protein [Bacilli bacterium]|nr:DUF4153 domain-containing protein [Bacilli bacterium]